MGLQVSIRESLDVTILDLRGRSTIDGGESELLNRHVQQLVASGARKLLLNLTDLTQIDSSGLGVIAGTCASLRSQGGDLRVLRPNGLVLEVFRVLHLLEMICSFDDEAQALGSFRQLGTSQSGGGAHHAAEASSTQNTTGTKRSGRSVVSRT